MRSLLLIDFDNAFRADRTRASEWLRTAVEAIMRKVVLLEPSCDFIQIRLYGGWRDMDGAETNSASSIRRALGADPLFPFRSDEGRIIRGSIELAESTLSVPTVTLGGTVRRRKGLPRFQFADSAVPLGCVAEHSCPLVQLKRMTNKQNPTCFEPSCLVPCSSAYKVVEQKLVDVMMACDILQSAPMNFSNNIFVLSNDVDLIPAIISARTLGAKVTVLYGSTWRHPYELELTTAGVDIQRTFEATI